MQMRFSVLMRSSGALELCWVVTIETSAPLELVSVTDFYLFKLLNYRNMETASIEWSREQIFNPLDPIRLFIFYLLLITCGLAALIWSLMEIFTSPGLSTYLQSFLTFLY